MTNGAQGGEAEVIPESFKVLVSDNGSVVSVEEVKGFGV
jgi:hypothetical protein